MRALAAAEMEVRVYTGRITNSIRLRDELADVETVIHLASGEVYGTRRRLNSVDVRGTESVVRASELMQVKRIIYVSRLGADADSMFPLLRAKGEAERFVRRGEVDHTIIRSATLFGREDRFLNVIAGSAAWTVCAARTAGIRQKSSRAR